MESFSATRLFLLKIIPCSPVATHTQTTPQPSVPLTEYHKSFLSGLASGKSGPGRESVQGSHGVWRGGGVSRWCGMYGFERR